MHFAKAAHMHATLFLRHQAIWTEKMEEETKLHKQRIDALSNEQQRTREEWATVSSIMQNLQAGFKSTQQKMKTFEGTNDVVKNFGQCIAIIYLNFTV